MILFIYIYICIYSHVYRCAHSNTPFCRSVDHEITCPGITPSVIVLGFRVTCLELPNGPGTVGASIISQFMVPGSNRSHSIRYLKQTSIDDLVVIQAFILPSEYVQRPKARIRGIA